MLTLRRHKAHDYAVFPDIDHADAGILSLSDYACLEEIGAYLLSAQFDTRFGLTLLHSHFPLDDAETLVEEIYTEADVITLRPARVTPSHLFATNVCFDDLTQDTSRLPLVGLEYAPRGALAGVAPIGEIDRPVLADVAGILRRFDKTPRFRSSSDS